MSKKETLFYKAIKKDIIGMGFTLHRIENIVNCGTPDILGFHKNIGYFTLELKTTNNDKVIISSYQIAFNKTAYNNGAKAFYLVKAPEQRLFKLYKGNMGLELANRMAKTSPLIQDSSIKKIFSYLLGS